MFYSKYSHKVNGYIWATLPVYELKVRCTQLDFDCQSKSKYRKNRIKNFNDINTDILLSFTTFKRRRPEGGRDDGI